MRLLIHGENTVLSRHLLTTKIASHKSKDIIRFQTKIIDDTQLIQAFESDSLFNSDRLIVIENPTKKATSLYLSLNPKSSTSIIIWFSKTLSPTQLKVFSQHQIEHFKISPRIFQFLDSIKPRNQAVFLPLFSQCCQTDSVEFVFIMLIRHLQELIKATNSNYKIAPWKLKKMVMQINSWSQTRIFSFHQALYDLDYRQKSGRLITSLESELISLLTSL